MSRKKLIRTNLYPYHVTTRTINKEWFDIPIKEVWRISLYCLKRANEKHPIELISFVLMSNHYHILLKTPNCDLDKFMYEFNKHLANIILKRSGRINRVFGNRYKWCLIRSQSYLYNCYRYVYQNPKRAGLLSKCENYPYSTLFYLTHGNDFPIPIYDVFGFKDKYALKWINDDISDDELTTIRTSLNRSELTELKSRKTRTLIDTYLNQKSAGTF